MGAPSLLVAVVLLLAVTESLSVNVIEHGAKPDGKTESIRAFVEAWEEACASEGAASVEVPYGEFLLSSVIFSGPCKSSNITFLISGTIVAPSDYHVIASSGIWILFTNVKNLTVIGGVLDARGADLWECKKSGSNCPAGATSLGIWSSTNVTVTNVTSVNSQLFHMVVHWCGGVRLEGLNLTAPDDSPNTDGIHVQMSENVTVANATIGTGDDCVSVGPGTKGLVVEGMLCGPGHGMSIGSLGNDMDEAGVENVTVRDANFTGTENGLRIKAWGKPSNGFAKGILFQRAVMVDVQNPIVIDQNYCPHRKNCPGQASGVQITNVSYQNVTGSSATPLAVKFDCSPTRPCLNITLTNVELTCQNSTAQASCSHAAGSAFGVTQPSSCLKLI